MGEAMSFRVGQEVVCVDASIHEEWTTPGPGDVIHPGLDGLEQGATYTIRGLYLQDDCLCVQLEEIVRDYDLWLDCEVGFSAARFRPIVKTDISIFQAMLAPSPKQRVDADA